MYPVLECVCFCMSVCVGRADYVGYFLTFPRAEEVLGMHMGYFPVPHNFDQYKYVLQAIISTLWYRTTHAQIMGYRPLI